MSGSGASTLHRCRATISRTRPTSCPATATAAATSRCAGRAISTSDSSLQVQAYYDHFRRRFLLRPRRAGDARSRSPVQSHRSGAPRDRRRRRRAHDPRRFVNNANVFGSIPASRRLWICNGFVQDRFALTPELSLIAGIKARSARPSPASSCCPICASPGSPIRTTCSGPRCRARCARRRGSTATSPAPPILVRGDRFPVGEADRLRGRLSRPAEQRHLALGLGLLQSLRRHPHHRVHRQPAAGRSSATASTGHTYGLEAWGSWQALPWWRLSAGVSPARQGLPRRDRAGPTSPAPPRSATIPITSCCSAPR